MRGLRNSAGGRDSGVVSPKPPTPHKLRRTFLRCKLLNSKVFLLLQKKIIVGQRDSLLSLDVLQYYIMYIQYSLTETESKGDECDAEEFRWREEFWCGFTKTTHTPHR